jgi:hypothetical protein
VSVPGRGVWALTGQQQGMPGAVKEVERAGGHHARSVRDSKELPLAALAASGRRAAGPSRIRPSRTEVVDPHPGEPAGAGLDPPHPTLPRVGQHVSALTSITPPGSPLLPLVEDRSHDIEPTAPHEGVGALRLVVRGYSRDSRDSLADLDGLFVPADHERVPFVREWDVRPGPVKGGVEAPDHRARAAQMALVGDPAPGCREVRSHCCEPFFERMFDVKDGTPAYRQPQSSGSARASAPSIRAWRTPNPCPQVHST